MSPNRIHVCTSQSHNYIQCWDHTFGSDICHFPPPPPDPYLTTVDLNIHCNHLDEMLEITLTYGWMSPLTFNSPYVPSLPNILVLVQIGCTKQIICTRFRPHQRSTPAGTPVLPLTFLLDAPDLVNRLLEYCTLVRFHRKRVHVRDTCRDQLGKFRDVGALPLAMAALILALVPGKKQRDFSVQGSYWFSMTDFQTSFQGPIFEFQGYLSEYKTVQELWFKP